MKQFVLNLRLRASPTALGFLLLMVFSTLASAQYDSPGSDAIVDDSEYHADSLAQEKADQAIDAVSDEALRAKREEDRHRMKKLGLEKPQPGASGKKPTKKSEKKSKGKKKKSVKK